MTHADAQDRIKAAGHQLCLKIDRWSLINGGKIWSVLQENLNQNDKWLHPPSEEGYCRTQNFNWLFCMLATLSFTEVNLVAVNKGFLKRILWNVRIMKEAKIIFFPSLTQLVDQENSAGHINTEQHV